MEKKRSKISLVIENVVEKFLWNFRFIIVLGVIGLLISSAVVFVMGIYETILMAKMFLTQLFQEGHIVEEVYNDIIVQTITTVDDFLLGTVLLIFGLGTYDLFISRIDPAEKQDDIRPDWLVFGSLDELKNVLGKVVIMIMTINFLKYVIKLKYESPLNLLYLGGAIALIGLALKFSHSKDIDVSTFNDRISHRKENSDH